MRRALLLLALASCAPAGPGEGAAAIVNGTSDAGLDPAVVLVELLDSTGTLVATCSGALVTPRVVLTAAHCANGSLRDASYNVAFADGYDVRTRTYTGLLAQRGVSAKWFNPLFDEKNLQNGYDMALLLLDAPAPGGIAPLALDRTRAVAASVEVRMVGFGLTEASSPSTKRLKLTATSTITDVGALLFDVDGASAVPCNGDSGGPALVTVAGKELVAGVVSFGDNNCNGATGYTFVAKLVSDIDAFVQANDPGDYGVCGADGTCGLGCATLDPDCPCAADGACSAACPDPDLDPDCPLGCGQNAICVRSGCPGHDPDCLDRADGSSCSSHNDCASDRCVAETCVPACGAGATCAAGLTCAQGSDACLPAPGGCAVAGGSGAGGWLALLLVLGLHRRRHHVADRRQLP